MYKISRTDKIDVNLYDERINHTGFIMYDRKRSQQILITIMHMQRPVMI